MPGLDNLKKFTDDITTLGNEPAIRQEQGTTMPEVDIPDNVPLEDDSYDFEFGIPEFSGEDGDEEEDISGDDDNIGTSDVDIFPQEIPPPAESIAVEDTPPELAALFNTDLPQVPPDSNDDETSEELADFEMPSDIPDLSGMDSLPDLDADTSDFDASLPDLDADTSDFDASLPELDADFSTEDSASDGFDDFSDVSGGLGFDDFSDIGGELNLGNEFSDGTDAFLSEVDISELSDVVNDFELDTDPVQDTFSADGFDLDTNIPQEEDFPSQEDDFDENSFEIPGFSDADAADSKTAAIGLFKKKSAKNDENERTHLTDTEYKLFKKNLESYPLNLRLAIEQVIVKNEFTDVVVLEILFKVVKRVAARQLASHLEKMLDISISVPLNYERRTVEDYESYKTSLEYQLKNRIIPGAIAAIILGAILYVLFYFAMTFIYRPIKAEMLYNEGYTLIENDLYSQSETNFNEALTYGVKKKWFFKYAQAYREKKQYERARNMYDQLVLRFDYDKEGGLEYARMELEDLLNYERAAEITRRYVLDHHINDKDAMLLLGDIFLEWATSLPPGTEKNDLLEQARLQYASLMDLYGSNNLYLSRMLRYFIRTDNFREVLSLSTHFTGAKEVDLEPNDLIELGGYLLDKRYGYLPPADEYLRGATENLKDILQMGAAADPTIPEGHYNFARYFVNTSNYSQAIISLNNAIATFETAEKQSHPRTLRHIDTYRLLAELYTGQQEYILAEQNYGDGISLFEQMRTNTELVGNENVGKLYSGMADLDYFISGDLQTALHNYEQAIENYNDTPSIRYRIGFIQYDDGNYANALGSFMKVADDDSTNRNLLLALGNVLSIRNDDRAAFGKYDLLIDILDADRDRYGIFFPQVREDHAEIVELYLKASNNLGVTLARLAEYSGNSALQGQALAYFSESMRAWDALTRNQETMVRLEGSNLAEQNSKFLRYPLSTFEPSIYASIPRVLYGEIMLEQSALN